MISKLRQMDWVIIAVLFALMCISALVVRSATYGDESYVNYDIKTLIFYAIGFFVVTLVTLIDYRIFLKFWLYIYGFGILLLILVFFFAPIINGARSWFVIADGILFQPGEMMKIILVITIAYFLGRRQGEKLSFREDMLVIFGIVFIPFALLLLQPDLGNAIIYIVILLGMLWIGNVRLRFVLGGIGILVAAIALLVFLFTVFNAEIKDYLDDQNRGHWYERINGFIYPEQADPDDVYQAQKARIAIGSGGLSGDGYMQGDSKNRKFIPYPYSDAIFVVIGEEFGFQGSAILILLYFIMIYRMIQIAFNCYDLRGAFMIVGIASMFVFQIFQNIGMMIGIMPITGITLPFISYGGTSLLLNMLSIGIVFSINAHQEKYELDDLVVQRVFR